MLVCREWLEPLDGYLMILYGDSPLLRSQTLLQLVDQQTASDAAGTLLSADMDDPTGYGRVIRNDADLAVEEIVEQKAANPPAACHPRSQHGHLLLPRRSLLEVRR